MKILILASLFISTSTYAQSINLATLKTLFTQKKETLERVNVGMSKKVVTTAIDETDMGNCDYVRTSLHTVLKIEGEKMIVHAKDTFVPGQGEGCIAAGYEAFEESMIFYEDVPSLASDLKDLDEAASSIRSISKNGEIITLIMSGEENTTFTYKYDLRKSSFKNLVSTVAPGAMIEIVDVADVDINTIDLKQILFCENDDNEISNCVDGDFSDILF